MHFLVVIYFAPFLLDYSKLRVYFDSNGIELLFEWSCFKDQLKTIKFSTRKCINIMSH